MGYTYATKFQTSKMKTDKHQRKYLKDYQPPDFKISTTHLEFHLDAARTRVMSRLQMHRCSADPAADLVLDGIELDLLELRVDGRLLEAGEYQQDDETLTLANLPQQFETSAKKGWGRQELLQFFVDVNTKVSEEW